MTKRFLSLVVAAAALGALTPLSATTSASEMNCRVPFAFTADGSALPAGTYSIANSNGYLLLRGAHKGVFVSTTLTSGPADRSGRGKLVFLRAGDSYMLVAVWSSDGSGRELAPSRRWLDERGHAANLRVEQIEIATR